MKEPTTRSTQRQSPRIGGGLLIALLCFAAWALVTAIAMRDPLDMMLEWELLAVFARAGTHGWYRTVIVMVGANVMTGAFIVAGAGWLTLLAARRSALTASANASSSSSASYAPLCQRSRTAAIACSATGGLT